MVETLSLDGRSFSSSPLKLLTTIAGPNASGPETSHGPRSRTGNLDLSVLPRPPNSWPRLLTLFPLSTYKRLSKAGPIGFVDLLFLLLRVLFLSFFSGCGTPLL